MPRAKFKAFLGALVVGAASLFGLTSVAEAGSIIPTSTPIPDSEVIINFLGTGLDWVYAGPLAPNGFGPGLIEPASYRAGEGWRYATEAEWALRPTWQDFTRPGFAVPTPIDGFNNHTVYRFTPEYWNLDYSHIDLVDATLGFVTGGPGVGSAEAAADSWYVRNTVSAAAVPLPPSAWMGIVTLGGLAVVSHARRRKSSARLV